MKMLAFWQTHAMRSISAKKVCAVPGRPVTDLGFNVRSYRALICQIGIQSRKAKSKVPVWLSLSRRSGIPFGRARSKAVEKQKDFAKVVDAAWYHLRYPDVAEADVDPVLHYMTHGWSEDRFPNAKNEAHNVSVRSIDIAWYLARYPDIVKARVDPVAHYVEYGWLEGRFQNASAEAEHLRVIGSPRAAVLLLIETLRVNPSNKLALESLQAAVSKWRYSDSKNILKCALEVTESKQVVPEPVYNLGAICKKLDGIDTKSINDFDPKLAAALDRLASDLESLAHIRGLGKHHVTRLVFDVTDLISHFRHQRLPTGIQRVQIEVISRIVAALGEKVRIGAFITGSENFLEIPIAIFQRLSIKAGSMISSSDEDWECEMCNLYLTMITSFSFEFVDCDNFINLGTSWSNSEYFLFVRNAKLNHNIRFTQFVHDLIPIIVPNYCVEGVVREYCRWLIGSFYHCDLFIANSQSTANDLKEAAAQLGHKLSDQRLEVVTLDADYRSVSAQNSSSSEMHKWGIGNSRYVLLVSTIEPRKNHLLAFKAWEKMLFAGEMPLLVCVGRRGWLSDDVFMYLDQKPSLRKYIRIIDRVDDDELSLLYRECVFTLYTSHYEGWGLPVTESLCYGKIPVVAENSSLVEAAGRFGIYFKSDSVEDLCRVLTALLSNNTSRQTKEAAIASEFAPRSWSDIGQQIARAVYKQAESASLLSGAPRVLSGAYYPLSIYNDTRIWRGLANGELYRIGNGWWPTDEIGSRTKPEGGLIRLSTADNGRLRLFLRMRGLTDQLVHYVVSINDAVAACGSINPGATRWIIVPFSLLANEHEVSIFIYGYDASGIDVDYANETNRIAASVLVMGLMLCSEADEDARMALIEASLSGDYSVLNAFAERGVPRIV